MDKEEQEGGSVGWRVTVQDPTEYGELLNLFSSQGSPLPALFLGNGPQAGKLTVDI